MSATIPRVKVKANRSHVWVDSEVRHLSHIKMNVQPSLIIGPIIKSCEKKLKKRMKHIILKPF